MRKLHAALKTLDAAFFDAATVLKATQAAGKLDLDKLTAEEMDWVDELQYIDTREGR